MTLQSGSERYLSEAAAIIDRIAATQMRAIEHAAQICAHSIGTGGLVHAFGTGHSRIPVEELFPRHGSFPGFHPIVELSLTNHTQIVGANGQRQAMWLEKAEGFGDVILRNFDFGADDSFIIFSNSGVNAVVIDIARGARQRGLPVIAVVSFDHSNRSASGHSTGQKLLDYADVAIDNCTPAGDAMVTIAGLADPVGPGSTIGFAAIANAVKTRTAELLVEMGTPPLVLSSSVFLGDAATERFGECYDEQSNRVSRLYDWGRS